jgi:hypothetical protein
VRLALVIVALAACSGGARTSEPVLSSTASERSPSTPAPRIAWRRITDGAGAFDIDQLPRVARSGQLAVVAIVEGDGGRGFPNLRLEARDRDDRVVEMFEVMTSNEYETLVPDGETPAAALVERIDRANRRLLALHARHELVAMTRAEPDSATRDAVLRRGWLAPHVRRCTGCQPCENPAGLAAVYQADGIATIVVRVSYTGTDLCWEPGDQLHVLPR